jgi:hypothetical protein
MRIDRSGKVLLGVILLQVAAWPGVVAQQTSTPELHHRSNESFAAQDRPDKNSHNRQVSTLPDDVSGSYQFDRVNESIEIDIERSKLGGYISQLGDAETDSNTPLTFFFDKTSIDGSQIEFQTRVVHGVWYSFSGTILRGAAANRAEEGYYILHGTLLEHHPQGGEQDKSADETIARRVVNFKSLGE